VYALTSPNPQTTMPPVAPAPPGKQDEAPPPPFLGSYPKKLSRKLGVTLFPLGTFLSLDIAWDCIQQIRVNREKK
jgi:hypothetical protein